MQSRRKIIIVAVAVLLSLLFLGAVALVVIKFMHFTEAREVLKADKERLSFLYSQNPFPSPANLKVERENILAIKQELMGLQEAMGAGQVEPVVQNPARFITQFFETQHGLLTHASTAGIAVPKAYDFGFGRHMKGDLPAPQDVPRLTQQLKIVEALCQILYAGNISALEAVTRQEFEVDAVAGGVAAGSVPAAVGRGRGVPVVSSSDFEIKNSVDAGAGLVPQGQLYGRWRFQFQFRSREAALLNILNGLARSPIFAVVTRLDVKGDEKLFERKDTERAGARVKTAEEPEKEAPKTRDDRIACGRENIMTVKMELDVYQFSKPQAVAPEKKPGGAN